VLPSGADLHSTVRFGKELIFVATVNCRHYRLVGLQGKSLRWPHLLQRSLVSRTCLTLRCGNVHSLAALASDRLSGASTLQEIRKSLYVAGSGLEKMKLIRLLHFTDIHVHSVSLAGHLPTWKELLGYANLYIAGRRKAFAALEAAKALCELVQSLNPDVVIFSSDLTSTGTCEEFATAYEHLRPLIESSNTFEAAQGKNRSTASGPFLIMVAGNHDGYTQ